MKKNILLALFVFVASLVFHWMSDKIRGIMVTEKEELSGLDVTVHGAPAYSEDK